MVVELHEHQQKAVDKMHNGSILCGDVGTGKTITSLAYFYTKVCGGVIGDLGSMRTPRDLIIITTAKKRDSLDWHKDAAKLGLVTEQEASVGGISMTVDSWNNIGKYSGVKDAFFIFDEQRVVGSGEWSGKFVAIAKSNQWILLSATPGDTWIDYIPVFLANGFYRNRTEFKNRHVEYDRFSKFPKVKRYHEVGHLVRLRNSILVEMPYVRHTIRETHYVPVSYDRDKLERVLKQRWHVYEERPLRDVAELFLVMRKVVNSDPSRLRAVKEMMETHPRLIVFYNFDYELEMLRSLASSSETERSASTTSDVKPLTLTDSMSGSRSSEENRSLNESLESKTLSEKDGSASSFEEMITGGHWTTDEGDGEMWIPHSTGKSMSEPGSSSGKTSPSNSDSKSSDEKDQSGVALRQLRHDTSNGTSTEATSFAIAEWNGHKHQEIPKTDRWVYLVQYVAGAEGWNCIETDAMVFYSLTYSYKNWHQAHGRIDRLNTLFTHLKYYVLLSDSIIDKAVMKSLKSKKSFNESRFVGQI